MGKRFATRPVSVGEIRELRREINEMPVHYRDTAASNISEIFAKLRPRNTEHDSHLSGLDEPWLRYKVTGNKVIGSRAFSKAKWQECLDQPETYYFGTFYEEYILGDLPTDETDVTEV